MDPTPAYEIAPMLLEAGEPSLPPRSRFAVPFGVFALVLRVRISVRRACAHVQADLPPEATHRVRESGRSGLSRRDLEPPWSRAGALESPDPGVGRPEDEGEGEQLLEMVEVAALDAQLQVISQAPKLGSGLRAAMCPSGHPGRHQERHDPCTRQGHRDR